VNPSNSIALRWTAPGDDGNVGRATSYDLRYRTGAVTGTDTLSWWNAATQATGEPVPRAAGQTDSTRVSGLNPSTTYYFIIRAADEVPNWSGFSNVAVRTTGSPCTTPTAPPQQFAAAEDSSARDVLLSWNSTSDPLAAFMHIYWATGPTGSFSLLASLNASETQFRHDTVNPGGTYRYRAAWAAACGEGPQTSIVSITISGTPPPGTQPDADPDLHAYPNPASGPVEFVLTLSGTSAVPVRIRIFDLAGHWVADLMNGTYSPGTNRITWPRTSRDGQPVAPGYYEAIGTAGEGKVRERIALLP
jgi:hypothetical protein